MGRVARLTERSQRGMLTLRYMFSLSKHNEQSSYLAASQASLFGLLLSGTSEGRHSFAHSYT